MRRKLLIGLILGFLWPAISFASAAEEKIVLQAFPQTSVIDSSLGIIAGEKHLAAVIFNESKSSIALVIFVLDSTGNSKLRVQSQWWTRHDRWYDTSVKVKNNSVYFSITGSGGCCSDYSTQYQFKPMNGEFTLIGIETTDFGFETKNDKKGKAIEGNYIYYKNGTSINYLAGLVSHWREQAPSSTSSLSKDGLSTIKVGKKRKDNRFSFAPPSKVLLTNFDIWEDPSDQIQHIGGYIDQNLIYHE